MSSKPLLYVFFGLISFATCQPRHSQEFCADVKGNVICYIRSPAKRSNWNKGNQSCSRMNHTLPIIRSVEEMSNLKNYLDHLKERKKGISSFWLAGEWQPFKKWTWVDDKTFNQNVREFEATGWYGQLIALPGYDRFDVNDPFTHFRYICQHDGECVNDDDISMGNSCLILSEDTKSWYEAREYCLEETGGDLAVTMDPKLRISKDLDDFYDNSGPDEEEAYWIGLRKGAWFWKSGSKEPDEVKFFKWDNRVNPPRNVKDHDYKGRGQLCISSNGSTGDWRISFCNESHSVICQRRVATLLDTAVKITEQDQISTNAFMLSTIIAAVLLIVAAVVIVCFIVQKKASDIKRQPSSERQYENCPTVRAVNDPELIDQYEAIELKDNIYQVIRISDATTSLNSAEAIYPEVENATGNAPESKGEQSQEIQDCENVYSDPDTQLGDQIDAIEQRKDCQ